MLVCGLFHMEQEIRKGGESMNKRMNITISSVNYEKLQALADRYGVTANSLITVIVGQWLDDIDEKVERLPYEVARKAYMTDRLK